MYTTKITLGNGAYGYLSLERNNKTKKIKSNGHGIPLASRQGSPKTI
jgi:hypothetical protein